MVSRSSGRCLRRSGAGAAWCPPARPTRCSTVRRSAGRRRPENAFPWIERDSGIEVRQVGPAGAGQGNAAVHPAAGVLRRRRGVRPEEHHHRGAHGHEAAVSIDRFERRDVHQRPPPHVNLMSQKMGIHEWSYDNAAPTTLRFKVPWAAAERALASIKVEVNWASTPPPPSKEAERCLNCDVRTVFTAAVHRVRRLRRHLPDGLHQLHRQRRRGRPARRLKAPARTRQDLYVSGPLKTGRVMVKDEDVCLHCGLCAERCPTGAWDMQKFLLTTTAGGAATASRKGRACQSRHHERIEGSTTSSSSSPTSTARARPRPTSCSPRPSCAWACRSARATSSPATSRACPPGTRCGVEPGWLGRRGGIDMMVAMNPQTWDAGRGRGRARRATCSTTAPGRCRRRLPRRHEPSSACRSPRSATPPTRTRASASCSRTSWCGRAVGAAGHRRRR